MALVSSEYKECSLLEKIKILDSVLGSGLSNNDFRKMGLVTPAEDDTEIRFRCFKCIRRKGRCSPIVKKSVRSLLKHLSSSIHRMDSQEFPTNDQSKKMIFWVSYFAQMHYFGDRIWINVKTIPIFVMMIISK